MDIMNVIGKCVVAGNVRRTAEIAFGDPCDQDYISLKDYNQNPERAEFGWTSNNSVFATLGMDYSQVCERVITNGEPGFAWLENMRKYGRMCDPPNNKDHRALGGNPCLEQTLESYELCCLVETFPNKHDSLEDFMKSVHLATTYAKTVTLGSTHWPQSNKVMLRNRRIGVSMSGVAQFLSSHNLNDLKDWCNSAYEQVTKTDISISESLAIPKSIKTTSIKPSGTVSLLNGSTPGLHYPESRFYIRRMRLAADSPLVEPLKEAKYDIEPAVGDEQTLVVSIPVDVGENVRTLEDVNMWEQLSLAAFFQRYWADNQVSCTISFDPETEGPDVPNALNVFQFQLKGISFLPKQEHGAYAQMPYEEISQEEYEEMSNRLSPIHFKPNEEQIPTMESNLEVDDERDSSSKTKINGKGINGRSQFFSNEPLLLNMTDSHPSSSKNNNISDAYSNQSISEDFPDKFCDSDSCQVISSTTTTNHQEEKVNEIESLLKS